MKEFFLKFINSMRFWLILITFFIIISYIFSITNDFALDDTIILNADYPRSLNDSLSIFQHPITYRNMSYYRPITFITFNIDWTLWEYKAFGYHITNIILACISACFILFWLSKIWEVRYAGLSVLIFSLFPGHSEAILSIYNRSQVLSSIFISLAICLTLKILHQYYEEKNKENSSLNTPSSIVNNPTTEEKFYLTNSILIVLVSLFTLLGCLSKENSLIIPILLFIIFFLYKQEIYSKTFPWKILFGLGLGQITAISIYIFLRYQTLGILSVPNVDAFVTPDNFWLRYVNHCYILVKYFILLIFPHPLSPDYPLLPMANHINCWIFPFIFIFSLWGLIHHNFNIRLLSFAFFWFWINLFPVLHISQLQIAMADRMLYPASLSLGIVLSLGIKQTYSKFKNLSIPLIFCVLAILLGGYFFKIFSYSYIWKNSDSLWDYALQQFPNSYRSLIYQGNRAVQNNDFVLAKKYYDNAQQSSPNRANLALIYQNLAYIYAQENEFEKMKQELEKILVLYPHDREANFMLGDRYLIEEDYSKASSYFQTIATPYNPWDIGYLEIMEKLAYCAERINLWELAAESYSIILERAPHHPRLYYFYYHLAIVYHYWNIPNSKNISKECYIRAKLLAPANIKLPPLPEN